MLKRVDYDQTLHAGYAKGRALLPVSRANWLRAFWEHAPLAPINTILDVGSGTGRFSPSLADGFEADVIGVEPSHRMREVAETEAAHPRVTYTPGSAADVPVPDAAADLALMFLVWHHVHDKSAAADELARTTRPGARLLIAGTYADRLKDLVMYRYFPRARDIDRELFQPVARVIELFADAGFSFRALTEVRHRSAGSLADYVERQRLRAFSVYEHLSEEEYETGLAAMEADAAAETEPAPIESECDLLVMTRN